MCDYKIIEDITLTSRFINKPAHEALRGFHVLVIERQEGGSHVDLDVRYFDDTVSDFTLVDSNSLDAIIGGIRFGLEAGYIAAKAKRSEDILLALEEADL